jgi:hypothetical protein
MKLDPRVVISALAGGFLGPGGCAPGLALRREVADLIARLRLR